MPAVGKDAHIELDTSGGALTDRTADAFDIQYDFTSDEDFSTAFGDAYKKRIGLLKDFTMAVQFRYSKTVRQAMDAILGLSGSFELGPAGTTTGNIKYSGEVFCQNIGAPISVDGQMVFTVNFAANGSVTAGTY